MNTSKRQNVNASPHNWDIRRTYYYLVCFATLIMLIVGSVRLIQHTLDLVMPEEAYRPSPIDMYHRYQRPGGETTMESPYTQQELEQMADDEAARMERQNRRHALRNLLGSLALVLISAPVYFYHWKKVRGEERLTE